MNLIDISTIPCFFEIKPLFLSFYFMPISTSMEQWYDVFPQYSSHIRNLGNHSRKRFCTCSQSQLTTLMHPMHDPMTANDSYLPEIMYSPATPTYMKKSDIIYNTNTKRRSTFLLFLDQSESNRLAGVRASVSQAGFMSVQCHARDRLARQIRIPVMNSMVR